MSGTRLFENRALRGIFAPKREVTGEWRKLRSQQLHNFYSLPNVITANKQKKVQSTEEMTNSCIVLDRKPEGKRITLET
jgi:hypothetical protein